MNSDYYDSNMSRDERVWSVYTQTGQVLDQLLRGCSYDTNVPYHDIALTIQNQFQTLGHSIAKVSFLYGFIITTP